MNEYKNPFHSIETNLEIAIGAIDFRDRTIDNLRQQIEALQMMLIENGVPALLIADAQYAHLRGSK